jgi:hypothetical protein
MAELSADYRLMEPIFNWKTRVARPSFVPPSRRMAGHLCAVVAAACLLLSGAFVRPVSVQAQAPATLKVMDWNIHHGLDTGGANNLERVVTWIVNVNPGRRVAQRGREAERLQRGRR